MAACTTPLTDESREEDEIRRVHEQYLAIVNDQGTDNLDDKCSRLYDVADKSIIDRALIISRAVRYAEPAREILSDYKGSKKEINTLSNYFIPKFNRSIAPSIPTQQAFIKGCQHPFFFQIFRNNKPLSFQKIIAHDNQNPFVVSQGNGLSTYTWYRKIDGQWKFVKTKITSNFYASIPNELDHIIGGILGHLLVMSEIKKCVHNNSLD